VRRILCPVDFEEPSRWALRRAVAVARAYGAGLDVLHVAPSAAAAAAARGVLDAWCQNEGLPAHGHVSRGEPAHEIIAYAAAQAVDLIVLGTHGRDGVRRLIVGSVANTVIRRAGRPVMAVSCSAGEPAARPFERILCPIDFSPLSRRALRHALALGRLGRGDVSVLYVMAPTPIREGKGQLRPTAAGYRRFIEAQMGAQIEDMGAKPGAGDRGPRLLVCSGPVGPEILAAAAETSADVIVMGVHGRGALDVMLFGSATSEVVHRATCPVLTIGASSPLERSPLRAGGQRLLDFFISRSPA
jgi:nucleotide-binding universal stress UspA family protein